MKYLILLSVAFVAVNGLSSEAASKLARNIMKIGEQCRQEVGANAEDISRIMQKKIPTRRQGKCLIFCTHQRIGFQDASGKKDLPGINTWIEQMKALDASLAAKFKDIADKCLSMLDDSGDACDVAASAFECYMSKAKELGVTVII